MLSYGNYSYHCRVAHYERAAPNNYGKSKQAWIASGVSVGEFSIVFHSNQLGIQILFAGMTSTPKGIPSSVGDLVKKASPL